MVSFNPPSGPAPLQSALPAVAVLALALAFRSARLLWQATPARAASQSASPATRKAAPAVDRPSFHNPRSWAFVLGSDEVATIEVNDALDGRVNVIINRGEAALGLTLCARGAEIFRDIVADTAAAATRGAGEAA